MVIMEKWYETRRLVFAFFILVKLVTKDDVIIWNLPVEYKL